MRRQSRYLIIVLLALLAAGAAALWYYLPALAGWGAERWLEARGASEVQVEVSSVGTTGARVDSVALVWNGGPQVQARDLQIRYRPRELLEGRLQSVSLGDGQVRLAPAAQGAREAPPDPGALLDALDALAAAPVERVDLHGVAIAGGPLPRPLNLTAHLEVGRAQARLAAEDVPPLALEAAPGEQGWALTLDGVEGLRAELRLSRGERFQVQWQAHATLAALRPYLPFLSAAAAPPAAASASLELAGSASFPSAGPAFPGLRMSGDYRLQLGWPLPGGGRLEAAASGAVSAAEGRWEAGLAPGSRARIADGGAPAALEVGTGWRVQGALEGLLAGTPAVRLEGPARLQAHRGEWALEARVGGLHWNRAAEPTFRARVQGALEIPRSLTEVGGVEAKGALLVRLDRGTWVAELERGARALVHLDAGTAELEAQAPALLRVGGDGAWQLTHGGRWQLRTPEVVREGVRLEPARLLLRPERLAGSGAQWRGSLAVSGEGLRVRTPGGALPALGLDARLSADPRSVRARGSLDVGGAAGLLAFDADHAVEQGRGSAGLELGPLALRPEEPSLAARIGPAWDYPLDVGAGRLAAAARLEWTLGEGATVTGHGVVTGEGLAGYAADVLFADADLHLPLVLEAGALRSAEAGRLQVATLTAGLAVHDLALQASLRLGAGEGVRVRVQQAEAQLLGGRVATGGFALGAGETAQFTVRLEDIELANVLALEEGAGLSGTGRLGGVLPVRLGPAGVQVDRGAVSAGPTGGVIRLEPNERTRSLAASNENMALAVQALRNFHYDVLSVAVDYGDDGQLVLAATLQGHNPDLYDGRAVRFNVTVEENLPALLRSLRAGDALSRDIERWVRELYESAH